MRGRSVAYLGEILPISTHRSSNTLMKPVLGDHSMLGRRVMSADPVMSAYIVVAGAADAIEFYSKVFGAVERMRLEEPSGRIGHAELVIGDSVLMLADEHPELGVVGPRAIGGSPVSLHLRVDDVDAVSMAAEQAGATI